MRNLMCCAAAFLVYLLLCVLPGCSNHKYAAGTITSSSQYPAIIGKAKRDKRYLVLHSGINVYSVTSAEMDKTKQQMTVQLDKVDSLYLVSNALLDVPAKRTQVIPAKLHLYMQDSTSYTLDEPHTIFLNKITRLELVN